MKHNTDIFEMSDENLVSHILASDKEAYSQIVLRYEKPLLRYIGRYVFEPNNAQDVLQEVFIKAYINLQSFNTKLKFSSWLYRIAHNEAVNHIKKHSQEIFPDDEDWLHNIPSDRPLIDEDIDKKMSSKLLFAKINQLPGKYRDPLILYYFEYQSYQEISDVLKIPVSTAGIRIKRAKDRLKQLLS